MNHYHQTTPIAGAQLTAAIRRAETQDERVLRFFEAHRDSAHTASQVFSHFDWLAKEYGLTPILEKSVRRAMSNLTRSGQLVHHKTLHRIGPHGATETFYQLKG